MLHNALTARSTDNQHTPSITRQGPEEEEASFPTLESVRQMREICRVFKTLILEVQGDARRWFLHRIYIDTCDNHACG